MAIDDNFTAKDMFNDLKSAIEGKGRCYLFLDELQEVDGWERAVNNLLECCDVSIPVYTLSFKEYLNFKGKDVSKARTVLDEYIQYGGFPLVGIGNFDTRTAYQIVEGIYASVITRDISKRHQIRNKELFDRVVRFIVENVGMTFSASSIVKFLKSENRTLSVEAIYNYLKWLTEAFIIYPCQRYDLQGKAILKTQEKYYLSDISFRYCQTGFDGKMLSAMLENVVYLEMRRRGYDVYIGKNTTKEIDFVGVRREERVYVQVCVDLPSQSTRETDNLMNIKDHYHKYVVCRDPLAIGNHNGIEIVHVADFLLRENW